MLPRFFYVPQVLEMFHEGLARVDAGDVGQDELAEFGIFDEGGFLQSCDFIVVDLHHVVIGQRSACLIVDLETRVELQHIQQLVKEPIKSVRLYSLS